MTESNSDDEKSKKPAPKVPEPKVPNKSKQRKTLTEKEERKAQRGFVTDNEKKKK